MCDLHSLIADRPFYRYQYSIRTHSLGYVRVNYVAAFQEIEFEVLVGSAAVEDAAWTDKWRRLILAGGDDPSEADFVRRELYREEEEGPDVEERDA